MESSPEGIYSPEQNPIEGFYARLKSFLKRTITLWKILEKCISVVGAKEESTRGYFRCAGLKIAAFDT